jgi:hypothetical protein
MKKVFLLIEQIRSSFDTPINQTELIPSRIFAESVKQRLLNSGTLPATSTPEQLGELLKKDADKWARVIREKNIKPD